MRILSGSDFRKGQLVLGRLREFLTYKGDILDAIRDASDGEIGRKPLVKRAREIAEELASHAPHEIKPLLMSLLGNGRFLGQPAAHAPHP